MADLFSNVPIPRPIDPVDRSGNSSMVDSVLQNNRMKLDQFRLTEATRREDLNSLAEFDIAALGDSFGGVFRAQSQRAQERIRSGEVNGVEAKALVVGLTNDYRKYKQLHADPFENLYGNYESLSMDPNALKSYNENLPIGEIQNPMTVEDLALARHSSLNEVFDGNDVKFDESGQPLVKDPATGSYVKPEMVGGVGQFSNVFQGPVATDIGSLYDWGASEQTKNIVSRNGLWNESAANDLFDLSIMTDGRKGATRRSQFLASYESKNGEYFTDDERKAFVNLDRSNETVWGDKGIGHSLLKEHGHDLWKEASYFKDEGDKMTYTERKFSENERNLKNDFINKFEYDKYPTNATLNSQVRHIGLPNKQMQMVVDGQLKEVSPQYLYLSENEELMIRANVVESVSQGGPNVGNSNLNIADLTVTRTLDLPISGPNRDAINKYVIRNFGGATLEDIMPAKFPEGLAPVSTVSAAPFNDIGGFQTETAAVEKEIIRKPLESSDDQNDVVNSIMKSFTDIVGQNDELYRRFSAGRLMRGMGGPASIDRSLEPVVKNLVKGGYGEAEILTALQSPFFADYLKQNNINTHEGGGVVDRLSRFISAILDGTAGNISNWESKSKRKKRKMLEGAESAIFDLNNPDVTRLGNE